MKKNMQGFTLIELMIVVAIIAILMAIAIPAYQDYTVRSKVSEMMNAAAPVKLLISEAFQSDGLVGVTAAATEYNARAATEKQSKFVADIDVDTANGMITITSEAAATSGLPADAAGMTLTLTPNVQGAVLAGLVGPIDWACSSVAATTAGTRGLAVAAAGTLPAKYAPSECR